MAPKRIYIGGLTANISQSDVCGRFKPFGDVLETEIIKAKAAGGADTSSCRGFAYVTLEPKDEASLARMLSLVRAHTHKQLCCCRVPSLLPLLHLLLPPQPILHLRRATHTLKKLTVYAHSFAVQWLQVARAEAAC